MAEVNKSQSIRDHFKLNPKATTQEVVDALASHGITVTTGLVRTIKFKHNKRHATKKAAKAKSVDKQPEVSKSDAIRDYYKRNPKAKTSEVVDALKKQGTTVSVSLVTNVKSKHNIHRRAVRKVVAKGGVGIPEVKAALAFIKDMGGITAAKKALEVAQEIREIV